MERIKFKTYKKLHVNNRAQAIKISVKKGWFGVF